MLPVAPPDWKQYSPDPTPDDEAGPDVASYQPPARPKPVRSLAERTVRNHGAAATAVRLGVTAIVVGVVGLVGWIVVDLIRLAVDDGEPQTAEGFAEMVDELGEETGGTEVFRAVIYPGYAVLDVPVADDERYVSHRWDGSFTESTKSTSDDTRFDLADIDPTRFEEMCAEVVSLVEDPGDCYLIVEHPDESTDPEQGWISAYVSNEFSQGGYIEYDLDGNEVRRNSW